MNELSVPPRALSPSRDVSTSPSSFKPMVGLLGVLLAAMMAGLNSRVGSLALADIRGALGFGYDGASWLSTAYMAGELVAMPFAAWFALTLSMRRLHLWTLTALVALSLVMPHVVDLTLLVALRFVQGVCSGTLIPILMMAALKFLPAGIRLHGLALYALTATFTPNVAIWIAGAWTDSLGEWRWVYWQTIPVALVAGVLVHWGLPTGPVVKARFAQANWPGMAAGVPALVLVSVAVDQGVRMDWFNAPLVQFCAVMGLALLAVYLLTEWHHPSPFIRIQMLERRNLAIGCVLFFLLLVVLLAGSLIPSAYLASIQGYRPAQSAPVGLIVAIPQLLLGSVVALLLYRKWIDARSVLSSGLLLIAGACLMGASLDAEWNREQFIRIQGLHALGQPMAVVSILFLMTSVVSPEEGPFISGTINTIRALGTMVGAAAISQFLVVRGRFHAEMILDRAGQLAGSVPLEIPATSLGAVTSEKAAVLASGDAYRLVAVLAILGVPLALGMAYVPPPSMSGNVAGPAE